MGNLLRIEDSIPGVQSSLILCSVTNQSFLLREGNERRSNTVTLLVGNYRGAELSVLQAKVSSFMFANFI